MFLRDRTEFWFELVPQWDRRRTTPARPSACRRREQTALALLDAARRVLAAKGYHGTKIVDIARAASVGVGTFYLYYPTKEALFLELVEDTVGRLKAEMDAVRERIADPLEQSRIRTLTFFRFAQENRELFRIVFGHGASFHDVVRRCQEGFIRDLHESILTGIGHGDLRQGDAMIWAQAMIGMSLQVVSWWIEQENVPIEQVATSLSDLALQGMAARH
ncbi:MAG: TetR/AcrR family transcriptional regulator [Candidatus Binatia bacterium]